MSTGAEIRVAHEVARQLLKDNPTLNEVAQIIGPPAASAVATATTGVPIAGTLASTGAKAWSATNPDEFGETVVATGVAVAATAAGIVVGPLVIVAGLGWLAYKGVAKAVSLFE